MKSFLSGRPTSPVPALKPLQDKPAAFRGPQLRGASGSTRSTAAGGSVPAHLHGPAVECIKQGDKVTHLIVTCTCGERIEIDCLYAGPA